MIFRAMVSAYPKGLPERAQGERVAFIEAANRNDARDRLPALVANVWRVPVESVEVWNLAPEFELLADPGAEGLTREQALFVIGWSGRPSFVDGRFGHPLFFLAGELDRVMATYLDLPRAEKYAIGEQLNRPEKTMTVQVPKVYSAKLNAKQNAVLEKYEAVTGMEPHMIEDFEAGHITVNDLWRHQVAWIEGVYQDVTNMGFPPDWDADDPFA